MLEIVKREPNRRSGDVRASSVRLLPGVLVRERRSAWVGAWESFPVGLRTFCRVQAVPKTFADEILRFIPS